ncbi:MAG: fimbrillin family protein [Bacteroidales bacterium]|nr:fimbrillin family protein [Bacteroidales bacterium]
MKKLFLIAASAMMLLASCTKVNVNYPDNGQPQEIAMFAVNKSATKAPVGNNSSFPADYEMKVAAYLASGAQDENGFTAGGDYFDGTIFKGSGNLWTGGKYWPVSTSTINFLAIAMEPSEPSVSPYTGEVSVVFGEKVGEATNNSNFTKQAVVTFENNQTTKNNYNQFDLMYAAGQGSHEEGEDYNNVSMTFKHALSWINFTVATNVSCSLKVNSIRLSKASYGGTLTISNANFSSTDDAKVETGAYTVVWTDPIPANDVYVPGAEDNSNVDIASELNVTTTQQPFGNGLLVVPVDYSTVRDGSRPTITINYTMNQGGGNYTFERTIEIPQIEWVYNKKYTYALTITLNEIKVSPSVGNWDNQNDIPVETDPEPQQQAPAQGE